MYQIKAEILKKVYRQRNPWSYKGNYGKLLVIAGGISFGSEVLVSLAAQRSGCDYIKVFGPKGSKEFGFLYPQIIFLEYERDRFDKKAIESISELMNWSKVIVVGNSIGTDKEQEEFVNGLINKYTGKIVIDADGIKVVDKRLLGPNILLTPNSYEFKLISGEEPSKDLNTRASQVKSFANKYNTNVLLKGHYDIFSDGRDVYFNKTNSVYMAKPGTGDVLAGIAASLIAQGNTIIDSALASAYINGYAGRLVSKEKGPALSPLDIIEKIPLVINKKF